MPPELKKILIIGPGPVIIGRGAELDLAAVQACQILRAVGFKVIAVDSNPAAVLTDRGIADRVYLEPLTLDFIARVIAAEKIEAILPLFGGQNALNLVYLLDEQGLLKDEIQIMGTSLRAIRNTEDLQLFYEGLSKVDSLVPLRRGIVRTLREGEEVGRRIGFPMAVKAAMAPEGAGVFIVYNQDEFKDALELALELSPIHQALLAEALLGWKEIEAEMLRDGQGDCRTLALTEHVDPVGIHSGDSMAVIPAQGLSRSDGERITELGRKVLETLGITGSASLQLAFNPGDGGLAVLEVNPRFTMNSALVSLATGWPVAVLATKIALGQTLAELMPAASGPGQNNILFKMPCFDFAKFPAAEPLLTSNMKSTGAAVAIGHNFKEAFQKAVRASERSVRSANRNEPGEILPDNRKVREKVINANPERLFNLRCSLRNGIGVAELAGLSGLSPWFLNELAELNAFERKLNTYALYNLPREILLQAKQWGYSDEQLAEFFRTTAGAIRKKRLELKIVPTYRNLRNNNSIVYSTYRSGESVPVSESRKIILVGGGPNRIGQGSEFEHNLLHAAVALDGLGVIPIVINCNPYSVTLNSKIPVKLYLEPVTEEDILNLVEQEKPVGVICQMGGPSAAELGRVLLESGVEILGANPRLAEFIEGTEQFKALLNKLGLSVIENQAVLESTEGAIGVEVNCIADGATTVICGMLEQIEAAGIHPGDSACSLPPYTLGKDVLFKIRQATIRLTQELGVKGMVNLHYAVKHETVSLMTCNLWAGRTVPFVGKTTGVDWVEAAVKVLTGTSLAEQQLKEITPEFTAIKEVVLPFDRFPGVDAVLGPEMRSTGMVMGISSGFGPAFIKAQLAAGGAIPTSGTIFISIRNEERRTFLSLAKQLTDLGFNIMAFDEDREYLVKNGVLCRPVFRPGEGRPNILDKIKNREVHWIISTTSGRNLKHDEGLIRSTAVARGIPIMTTLAAAQAGAAGVGQYIKQGLELIPFDQI